MKIRYRKNKIFLVIPTFVILMGIFFIPQTAYFAYITENSIIDLTNSEREKIGANELIRNDALDRAAQKKGEDILKNQWVNFQVGELVKKIKNSQIILKIKVF